MKEIIIRTNFNKEIGLGHIARCKILNEYFDKKKFKTTFIIDNNIKSKITDNLNIINLGDKEFNPPKDAKKVFNIIKNRKILFIIVDDYRIDYKWENYFYKKDYKIIVLDDLANRKHICSYLIDSGWYGKKINQLRYFHLINKNAKKLLGVKYKIINSKIKKNKINNFNILIYFGGGNHIIKYYKLLNFLINRLTTIKKKFVLNIVYSDLFNLKKINGKKNVKLKMIKGNFDLSNLINKTSLYLGSNSSIVNELSCLKIPRILISVNEFQNINIDSYQKLGNYICINYPNQKYQSKLAELTFQTIKNFKRVKNLFNKPEIKVNKHGAQNISKILLKKYDKKN